MIDNKIIDKENISLKIEANDWREAIRRSGEILKSNGYVKDEYIEDMVKAVEELGPYIVIIPHIAIAHARPSESVLKNGISLVTLREPVEFGNKDNDPVDLVFSLCATSNKSHLKALEKLSIVLEDEKKIQILRSSEDIDQVYKILNNIEEEAK